MVNLFRKLRHLEEPMYSGEMKNLHTGRNKKHGQKISEYTLSFHLGLTQGLVTNVQLISKELPQQIANLQR